MIGKLKGLVDSFGDDWVLIDCGGVCYEVHCSGRTLQALPRVGEAAVVFIETIVREDFIKRAVLIGENLGGSRADMADIEPRQQPPQRTRL